MNAAADHMAGTTAPRTLIVGLGQTGLSCARHLVKRGVPVAVTDSRARPPGLEQLHSELPDVRLFLGGFSAAAFGESEMLVVSPGVPLAEPLIADAIERGLPVLGDIELFAGEADAPVIAITGSNGKSTVTTLVGEMARRAGHNPAVGGNLGEPALELLGQGHDLFVLALSSFQLETTASLRTAGAAVLNVSPDHMDRYPDLAAYAAAKARVLDGARIAVLNRDDPQVLAMASKADRVVSFGLGAPAEGDYGLITADGELWLARRDQRLLPASALRIKGGHNLANALAALALGDSVGLAMPAMLEALRAFPGLPHRTQFVAEQDGVAWYNDSKGTNVGATIAALKGLATDLGEGRIVLIAGGEAKGADFTPLRPVVEQTARAVVLLGRDAEQIETALVGSAPVLHAADMADAVRLAAAEAHAGDRVLLSPACASFDMFEGYAQRGEVFIAAVRELLA